VEREEAEDVVSQRLPTPMRPIEMVRLRMKVNPALHPPVVFLPFVGEFGCMILYHIRFVHTYPAPRKIVCCRRGEEVFYPSAAEFDYDWQLDLPDTARSKIGERVMQDPLWAGLVNRISQKHEAIPVPSQYCYDYHVKFPVSPRRRRGLAVDVVLAPRVRQFQSQRNFNRWEELADAIAANGFSVGCVGKEDTSLRIRASSLNSWDCPDPTDAMIEMLGSCRAYVGTDTGPTHLAGFMDVPMVLFGNCGLMWVAEAASRAPWVEVRDGWDNPEDVVDALTKFLGKQDPVNPILTDAVKPALGFGHVFALNLDRRPDRRAWIDHHLFVAGIEAERFPAVEVEDRGAFTFRGQRGCLLSHRAMVERAVERGYESILILEDDARIRDIATFRRRVPRIVKELSTRPWDLFYFQHQGHAPVESLRYIQRTTGSWLTHAVAVHSRFYREYLRLADPSKGKPIDYILFHGTAGAEVYTSKEELIVQRFPDDSDINVKVATPAAAG